MLQWIGTALKRDPQFGSPKVKVNFAIWCATCHQGREKKNSPCLTFHNSIPISSHTIRINYMLRYKTTLNTTKELNKYAFFEFHTQQQNPVNKSNKSTNLNLNSNLCNPTKPNQKQSQHGIISKSNLNNTNHHHPHNNFLHLHPKNKFPTRIRKQQTTRLW
jgi:hypothetical protein